MRALLLELRPAALLETGLESLLRQLGEAVMGRENISVNIDVQGDCKLPPDVHIALYRIAQEALNNVVKHARARKVQINLAYLCAEDDCLAGVELSIRDDGGGFDLSEIPPERLGLEIMRERAEAIGAHLVVESRLGEGTQVVVKWTLDRRNDER
jgi:signal transduction histidine kinase